MTLPSLSSIGSSNFSNYSEVFATCSTNEIRIWNSRNRQELLRIQVPNIECHCVGFMGDGKSIISGWSDGKIRAFYPQSGKLMYAINDAHIHGVTAIAMTSDCNKFLIPFLSFQNHFRWKRRRSASLENHKANPEDGSLPERTQRKSVVNPNPQEQYPRSLRQLRPFLHCLGHQELHSTPVHVRVHNLQASPLPPRRVPAPHNRLRPQDHLLVNIRRNSHKNARRVGRRGSECFVNQQVI